MIVKPDSSKAKEIARAAMVFEQQTTGRQPRSVTVVVGEDTVVITLRGTFSPAETALANSEQSAEQLRELHRQLFDIASEPLRQEIKQILGVGVHRATAAVDTSTGTVVQVFSLAQTVPSEAWTGTDPGPDANKSGDQP